METADPTGMTNSPTLSIRVPQEIRDELEKHCRLAGITLAQLLIKAACNEIGKPELYDTLKPPHRPKAE